MSSCNLCVADDLKFDSSIFPDQGLTSRSQEAVGDDILIVDDEPLNLKVLSLILTEHGYKVRAVQNGSLAIAASRALPPDLILLDIMLPEMDGYEVCRRLKGNETTKDIPVMFISSLSDAEDKVKGFAVGGLDFITVPFQKQEMLARVETHLKLRRFQRGLRLQEELSRSLLNASPDASYLIRTDETIITCNRLGAMELDHQISDLTERHIWDFFPAPIAEEYREHMKQVILSGLPDRFELSCDGRYKDNVIYPLFDSTGKIERLAVYICDITERKSLEEEQRRYSENLEMLIRESPSPILFTDSKGKVTIMNQSAEALLGYMSDELLDKPLSKILSEDGRLDVVNRTDYPMHFVNKMGEKIPVTVSTSVQIFKDNKSGKQEQGMIVTLRDLSEMQGLCIVPSLEKVGHANARTIQLKLDQGYMYLIEEEKLDKGMVLFRDLMAQGFPGLCISRLRAEKTRLTYHLEKTPHIWLTRNKIQGENCVAPDELTKLKKTAENFIQKVGKGVLFFDGLEYLINQNGFDTVLKFINSINDLTMLCDSLAIWLIDPLALNTKELHILRRETRNLQDIERISES